METFLLIIGLIVVFDIMFVLIMGRFARIRKQQISKTECGVDKVVFRAEFFNPKSQVWYGYFYVGKERKKGYVSNLKWEHLQKGACCSARIIEFDKIIKRWKLKSLCEYD